MKPIIIDTIPEGFLECKPQELYTILPKPTLLCLKGRKTQPLFVSVLLHGNETSGFIAVQQLLKYYQTKKRQLPRSIILFIGNVTAARDEVRHLEDQSDYNRIWKNGNSKEHHLAKEIKEFITKAKPFAVIDIHNNTGRNPHYGCINLIDKQAIYLASLFSHTIVYFTKPDEVLTIAFKDLCPAVTIECGVAGDKAGVTHAKEFIDACLHLKSLDTHQPDPDNVHIFRTKARITIPKHFSIGIGKKAETDIALFEDIETLNFSELEAGTLLGWRNHPHAAFSVIDELGDELDELYFSYEKNEIRLKQPIIPSMFTKNIAIIQQDCLGYIMNRYS